LTAEDSTSEKASGTGKKVLIFSQYFWPEDFRVNDLAQEMRNAGFGVEVITGIPNYPKGQFFSNYGVFKPWCEVHEGITIYRIPQIPRGTGKLSLILNYLSFLFFSLLFLPFFMFKKYSAVFTFGVSPGFSVTSGAFLAKFKGIPSMIWILDLWPESLESVGIVKNRRILGLVRPFFIWLYKLHTIILCQSASMVEQLKKYGVPEKQIKRFTNWAEDTYGALPVKKSTDSLVILFAGNVGDAQDLPTLLGAAEALKDRSNLKWIILGDGRAREWVQAEVLKRGLSQNVELVPRRPQSEMPEWFTKADLMYVSLKPGSAMSMTIPGRVFSIMATGKPILMVADGDSAQLVVQANCGFVSKPSDPIGLARTVEKIMYEDPVLLGKLGLNGRKFFEENFSRKLCLDRFKKLLIELI